MGEKYRPQEIEAARSAEWGKDRLSYHPVLTPAQSGRMLGHLRNGATASSDLLRDEKFMSGVRGAKWEYAFARYEGLVDLFAACHYRFVLGVAKRHKRSLSTKEALDGGITGLHHAIEKFDVSYDNNFLAYAQWKILDGIQRAEREQLKITAHQQQGLIVRDKLRYVFREVEGRDPSPKELENQLWANSDLSVNQVFFALKFKRESDISLDASLFSTLDMTGHDRYADSRVNIENKALVSIEPDGFLHLIHSANKRSLTSNEYTLITKVFGFQGDQVSISTIAKEQSKDPQVVVSELEEALHKLRSALIPLDEGSSEKREPKALNLEHVVFDANDGQIFSVDLQRELDKFPNRKDKICFLVKEGYTWKEVASLLGITESNASVVISTLREEGRLPRKASRQELKKEAAKDPLTEKVRICLEQEIEASGGTVKHKLFSTEKAVAISREKRFVDVQQTLDKFKKNKEKVVSVELQQQLGELPLKRDKVCLLFQEGHTVEEIATHFTMRELRVSTVVSELRKEGRLPRKAAHQRQRERLYMKKNQICFLFQEGHTVEEIATHFKDKKSIIHTVLIVLQKEGRLPRKAAHQRQRERLYTKKYKIGLLFQEGHTLEEIVTKLEMTKKQVQTHIDVLRKEGRLSPKPTPQQIKESPRRKEPKEIYRVTGRHRSQSKGMENLIVNVQAFKQFNPDMTPKDIAKALDVNVQRVYRVLRQFNGGD